MEMKEIARLVKEGVKTSNSNMQRLNDCYAVYMRELEKYKKWVTEVVDPCKREIDKQQQRGLERYTKKYTEEYKELLKKGHFTVEEIFECEARVMLTPIYLYRISTKRYNKLIDWYVKLRIVEFQMQQLAQTVIDYDVALKMNMKQRIVEQNKGIEERENKDEKSNECSNGNSNSTNNDECYEG